MGLLGLFLGMFDLLIMTFVWGKITQNNNMFTQMEQDEDELMMISNLQVVEILFETLPQILLQSLFLMRTFDNDAVYDTNNTFNIYLVWVSLFISVVSATNKMSHIVMTRGGGVSARDEFKNKYNIRSKCPIINIGLLSKKIFFISTILTRLFVYSLLWSVCGGMFALFCIIIFAFLLQIVLWLSIPKFEQLSQEWEDNYQSKKQIKKSNVKRINKTKKKSVVDTMVQIQTSPK